MRWAWVFLLTVGCGPAVSIGELGGSTGSSDGSTGGTSDPSTDTGTPPDPSGPIPASTTVASASTTGGESSDATGVCDLPFDPLNPIYCEPPSGECNPAGGDCAEGEACRPWANDGGNTWNATRCVPVYDGAGGLGDPCTVEGSGVSGIDTCLAGFMCWNVDPNTFEGACAQFCDPEGGDPGCSDPSQTCNVSNDEVLPLCLPACDPLEQACGEGFGCYPGWEGQFVCLREGERLEQEGLFHAECPPGTFWATEEQVDGCRAGEPCCTPFCDVSSPSCEGGAECVLFLEGAVPGLETLGYCRPGT